MVARADQNTSGALLEFSMRTAIHETSCVSSAIFVWNNNKISPCSLNSVVAQWVRRWTTDHRVMVRIHRETFFSNCFYLSFMLGQVNFSDIVILCNRPNNFCQQNLKCFDEPLLSQGLFS